MVRVLIQNHLEDITHNRLPLIQKKTGFDLHTINEAIEVLKHLNPRPGSQFTADNIPYVVPDIVVERTEAGDYNVRLLDDWVPNIYISKRYIELYKDRGTDPKAREYLKRKIQAAQWLMESIEQRRNTLEKVTRAIIKHQRKFLDQGPEHIEPLKMQQIADLVGVHVTTVSRAVDDKWVQTPRGIFPLEALLRRRHADDHRRRSGLGDDQEQAAGDHRQRGQGRAAVRRGPGDQAHRGRLPGGPADGDEVSQDAEDSVVAAAQGVVGIAAWDRIPILSCTLVSAFTKRDNDVRTLKLAPFRSHRRFLGQVPHARPGARWHFDDHPSRHRRCHCRRLYRHTPRFRRRQRI